MRERIRKIRRILLLLLLLVVFIGISSVAVHYWQTKRLPGPGLPALMADMGITKPHFVFSIDGVVKPASVAISPGAEGIFVTETGGERLIHIFDYAGEHIKSFAPPDTTPSSRVPMGIAVSNDGKVYVTDTFNRNITSYSLDGEFIATFVPDNDPDFQWLPVGLTFDKEGHLYVTDHRNPRHQILVFDPSGNLKLKFGYYGKGEGMFNFPADVAVSDNGNIYVSDSNNSRIQVFDAQGNFQQTITGGFSLPRGIGFDSRGRLHVVDSLEHKVQVFSLRDGPKLEFTYGSIGLERGQFYHPGDLAVDDSGRMYITDQFGSRVQVWSF